MPKPIIHSFQDVHELAQSLAREILLEAQLAVKLRGRFLLCLAGGNTPRALYEVLATDPFRKQMPWHATHLFWGDERFVPLTDPESNYGMAKEALIQHVELPSQNTHPMPVHLTDLDEAAVAYDKALETYFADGPHTFDVSLLGLGEDGHTASLFPGSESLTASVFAVGTNAPPTSPVQKRISLSFRAFNGSGRIMLLVTGEAKRAVLAQVLHGLAHEGHLEMLLPAARLRPTLAPGVEIFADQAALGQS